ncbi:FAD-dependent monooxygenase [Pseudonocardia sp. CA-107938]|uniref:FAD-dependent monooxygenase n=1 Tax=Pseudonocardia sp. CA-107938 TaxID=3240021 RepID=UPI003D9199B6
MIDVLVAGAGPNGLMTACELALAGVQVVVLDPADGPDPAPRANGLTGRVVELLHRRGLYERLSGVAGPPRPAPHFMFAAFPLDLTGLGADNPVHGLPVPQREIVRTLAARAAELGVEVRWGQGLDGFTQVADHVTVEVDDGAQLSARWLVGADGGHSPTRKAAGIEFVGVTTDRSVNRAANAALPADWVDTARQVVDVPGYGPVPAFVHHRTERGLFVYAPFPGRAPLVSTTEWDRPADDVPMTIEELAASASRVLGTEVPLTVPAVDGPVLQRRTVGGNTRIADRFRAGRVLLVGDAAHVHSAIGGAGLNLGLQDAVNLAWKLAGAVHGWAPDGLLDSYEAERRPVGDRVLTQTLAQQALIAPGPEVTALRAVFGELLQDRSTVARIAGLISGADIRYGDADHPLVGRWAPDVVVDGRPLAELLRTARPLLLDLSGGAVAAAAAQWPARIEVVTGAPDRPYPATALLVRPDGYVAWASSADTPGAGELDDLQAAAATWFGVAAPALTR